MTDSPSDNNENLDEINTELHEKTVTIGQYLKFERELRDVSLKVVSQHTKISLTMLTYLEGEDYENLPDLAYVRGLVKNYSKALGISTIAALEVLEETYIAIDKQAVDITTHAKTLQNPEPIATSQNLRLVGIIVIVIAFVAIIATMTRTDNTRVASKSEVNTPKPTATPKEKTQDIKPTTLSATTPLNDELPTPKPTVVSQKEIVVTKQIVATPVPTATPEAIPTVTEVKVSESDKKEDEEEKKDDEKKEIKFQTLSRSLYSFADDGEKALQEFVPSSYKETIVAGKQNLYIVAKNGDTWITYKVDQQPVKKIILKDGRNLSVVGDEITAFLGNVHVTKIFLNNKLLKIESRSGVKSLIFPEERRDKHKYPLFIYNKDGSVTSSYDYLKQKEAEAKAKN